MRQGRPASAHQPRTDRLSSGQVGQVQPPSGRYQTYEEGNLFRVACRRTGASCRQHLRDVRARRRLRRISGSERLHARPADRRGGQQRAQSAHGDRRAHSGTRAEQSADSPDRRLQQRHLRRARGLATVLTNVSDVTRQQERIALYTTQLNDGSLFFVVGVAPAREFSTLSAGLQSISALDAAERRVSELAVLAHARCN